MASIVEAGIGSIVVLAQREIGFFKRARYLFGRLPLFALKVAEPVDPVTAIFNFLSTPEGQKLIDPLTKAEAEFANILAALIKSVGSKVTPAASAPTSPVATKS